MSFVANKVVVDEKDARAPAKLVQRIQLTNDLLGGLDAWSVPEERGDVAELAIEGTATRILDSHGGVVFDLEKFPQWGRGSLDFRKFVGCVNAFGATSRQVIQEWLQSQLRFVQDEMIDSLELIVFSGEKRAASHDFEPCGFAAGDDLLCRTALDDHGTDKSCIGPGQVLFGEISDVQIDQAFFPF